jgi:hypothetical protein
MDRPRSGRSRRGGRRRRRGGGGGGNREAGAGPSGPADGAPLPSVPNYSWGDPEPHHEHEHETEHEGGGSNGSQGSSAPAPASGENKPSMAWSSAPPAEPAPTTPHQND